MRPPLSVLLSILSLAVPAAFACEIAISLDAQIEMSDLIVTGRLSTDAPKEIGKVCEYPHAIAWIEVEEILKGSEESVLKRIPLLCASALQDGVRKSVEPMTLADLQGRRVFLLKPLEAAAGQEWFKPHLEAARKALPPAGKELALTRSEAEALAKDLGSEQFDRRETAQRRLAESGGPHLELLSSLAVSSSDPEVRSRLEEVLRKLRFRGIRIGDLHVFPSSSHQLVHEAAEEKVGKIRALLPQRPRKGAPSQPAPASGR